MPGSFAAFAEDGADQPGTGHRFAVDRWTEKEQKVVDALNQPLGEPLKFVDEPLLEVFEVIADTYQIEIIPDRRSLANAAINLNEVTVSINMGDVMLRSALDLILEQCDLAYVIQDEVLQILWEEDAESRLTTVVYDVRPLIEAGYTEGHLIPLIQNETSGPWFPDDPNKRIESLIGGLSIRQTQQVHNEVEALLQDILKLTQRHTPGQAQDVRHNEAPPEPENPVEPQQPDAQDGIAAHPVEAGKAYLGPLGQVIRPQWRVVIYDVSPLIEKGYEAERLSEVVRAVVQPEDWENHATTYPSEGFFSVPTIPDPRKAPAEETARQFGGLGQGSMGRGGMGTGSPGMGSMGLGGMGMGQGIEPQPRIEPLGNALVVYQSPSVQAAIEAFLQALNQMHRGETGDQEQQ